MGHGPAGLGDAPRSHGMAAHEGVAAATAARALNNRRAKC